MRINHNIASINTSRMLGINTMNVSKSLEKLSSGLRINRAGDDAAGLAISEKMRGQIRGLDQASRNAQDSISLIQTAEGALNETQSILQRMRELAVQAANDTNVTVDRAAIQNEMNQLTSEINRIGNTTEFNTMKLIDGSKSITSRDLLSTVRTVAASGVFTANYATGVAAVGLITDTDVFSGGIITLDNGAGADTATYVSGSVASTIQVTKADSNTFTIKITLTNSSATTLTAKETIDFTAGTDFTYDNHGISFTIDSDDFSKFTAAGTGVTISFLDAAVTAGEISTSSDWDKNSGSIVATITSGITFAQSAETEGARSIVIQLVNSATLTVNYRNSANASILQDTITLSAFFTSTAFTYDNHGLTFDFNAHAATSAKMTISLSTETTQYSSTTVDRSLAFQIGANESQSMSLSLNDMRADALGISATSAGGDFAASKAVTNGTDSTAAEYALDVSTFSKAASAITVINDAINTVSSERSKLGAVQNRLEHTIANLGTSSENLTAAESRIRDVDMAKEMMEFTRNNILTQAAQAMLAQANQAPQGVLQLLR